MRCLRRATPTQDTQQAMSDDKPLRVYALFLRFSARRSHLLFRRQYLLIVFIPKQQTDKNRLV
ncbi:MAG: hypothetical protein V7K90_03765 [Nostoc sp.]|uniref:hypothetical protein n=1 Tax=Nostoc sp. TaxID=1180 RepID=UPI002FFCC4F2